MHERMLMRRHAAHQFDEGDRRTRITGSFEARGANARAIPSGNAPARPMKDSMNDSGSPPTARSAPR